MALLCRNLRINQVSSPYKISMNKILSSKILSGFDQVLSGASFYSSKVAFPSVESLKEDSDSSKPWLMRPFKKGCHKFYDVGCKTGESGFCVSNIPKRCIASTKGWLAFMDENKLPKSNGEVSYYLRSPFQLPQKKEDIILPSVINLHYTDNGFLSLPETFVTRNMMRNFVLSSSDPYDPNCLLMTNVQDGVLRRLAYCRPGRTDQENEWTVLHDSYPISDQLVYSNKLSTFYTLSGNNECLEAWDFSKADFPKKKEFIFKDYLSPIFGGQEKTLREQCMRRIYIVVDDLSGDLLYVVKYYAPHVAEDGTIVLDDPKGFLPYKTQRIDVYKYNFDKKAAEYVLSLRDRALFLGFNQSFSLSAKDFRGVWPNAIYFVDDFPEMTYSLKCPYGGHDSGIYRLDDKSITPFSPLAASEKVDQQMLWVAPTTFSDDR